MLVIIYAAAVNKLGCAQLSPKAKKQSSKSIGIRGPLVRVSFKDLKMEDSLTQIEAQRSGFDLERRSDGVNKR